MGTKASWNLQVVEHGGESYLLLPRNIPSSYDIVRLKDRLEVGAVWLMPGQPNRSFHTAAIRDVSATDIRRIVMAGIKAGLFT
jgi:hypothetical protein